MAENLVAEAHWLIRHLQSIHARGVREAAHTIREKQNNVLKHVD